MNTTHAPRHYSLEGTNTDRPTLAGRLFVGRTVVAQYILSLILVGTLAGSFACTGNAEPRISAAQQIPSTEGSRPPAPTQSSTTMTKPPESTPQWSDIESLLKEDKYQAALAVVLRIDQQARTAKDNAALTRALITAAQLRVALGGYETAVEELQAAHWPEEPALESALDLFYAEVLTYYLNAYSWEIRQREHLGTSTEGEAGSGNARSTSEGISERTSGRAAKLDLKAWTLEQIIAEAHAAYGRVWRQRHAWGTADAGVDTVAVEELLEKNTYPEHIRGTMRDRLSYLWAALLINSSFWSAEDSNEVFKLDLDRLTSRDGRALSTVDLGPTASASPDTSHQDHPLLKVAAILSDLQRWHQLGGRSEAAMEAERERFERLHHAMNSSESSQQDLLAIWQLRVQGYDHSLPWWSRTAASLAQMQQASTDDPNALVTAHATASEAVTTHPESIGAKYAAALIDGIESPTAQVQGMWSDSPEERSFEITHRNLDTLNFRAWKVDLVARIQAEKSYGSLLDQRDYDRIAKDREPDQKWSVKLPGTPDFKRHRTFVTPPMREPGLYLVSTSTAMVPGPDDWSVGFAFLITDLVVLTQGVTAVQDRGTDTVLSNSTEYRVVSGTTGQAVQRATVDLYLVDHRTASRKVASKETNQYGVVRFDRSSISGTNTGRRNQYQAYEAVVHHNGQVTTDRANLYLEPPTVLQDEQATLLYTDRSIYRPGQTIHWKAVAYAGRGDNGRYQVQGSTPLEVGLADANGEEVAKATVTTNSFGSASGTFEVPQGRLLGNWSIKTQLGDDTTYTSIRIEEYKRPTFEVTVDEPEQTLRLNRPAQLKGTARYYFGLPVSAGSVQWQVTREPQYPWWWRWYGYPTGNLQTVAEGEVPLNAEGTFTVSFLPEAEENDATSNAVTYRYRLSVDVTDEGGETRDAERVFNLGLVTVQATIQSQVGFIRSALLQTNSASGSRDQDSTQLILLRTDLDGAPRAGEGQWQLFRLAQPDQALLPSEQPQLAHTPSAGASGETGYATPGDALRSRHNPGYDPGQVLRSWADGPAIARGTLDHGADGTATLDLRTAMPQSVSALRPGAYRLRYTTTDPFGATFETQHEFIVAGTGASGAGHPAANLNLPAILAVERSSVPVGEVARLLVHSALPNQQLFLELSRNARRLELRRLNSADGLSIIEIPITDELRGGFSAALVAVRGHQLMGLSEQITVPFDDRRLKLSFETFRDKLKPGDTETWTVKIGNSKGEPVEESAVELLAYMYDRSLDFFQPHRPPSIVSLYQVHSWPRVPQSSLGGLVHAWQRGRLWRRSAPPNLQADRLSWWSGYGIGGPGLRNWPRKLRSRGGMANQLQSMGYLSEELETMTVSSEAPLLGGRAIAQGAQINQFELEKLPTARSPWVTAEQQSGEAQPEPEIRTNFTETAFWHPHLITGKDGTVSFEFTVPDSLTEWNIWLHGLTRDLRGGSKRTHARTVKDLLVRPYLPRFLREGDQAELVTVINNAGEVPLDGELQFDIIDPLTEESLLAEFGLSASDARRSFHVLPGEGASLSFNVTAPTRVGTVAFRVVASSGDLSDGELRPIPVLPGRFHLLQSRFTTLHDKDRRKLRFKDLQRDDDPTRINDQVVVTLDGQLFYSVLGALPYLINYPYECTEQTLNRFLSTGILSSLFDRYPAVSAMVKKLSERDQQYEAFDTASGGTSDANRTSHTMLLEESPWLNQSRGNGSSEPDPDLIKVLDPTIADAQRRASWAKLAELQTSSGGFPWFAGGRPSPYMTLYTLDGLSRALELGVSLPEEAQHVVRRAWQFMQAYTTNDIADRFKKGECCVELVTYLNYVLSNYAQTAQANGGNVSDWTGGVFSAEDRTSMLDHSFDKWRTLSPRIKALLALTLHRAERQDNAQLVIGSIMDSAKTERDLGTYWAPEDRSWLWYNDTIESHAFILRALSELEPKDERRHGLVQWLFLNKKLNHWKSTRATAEVLYALVHYLEAEGQLGLDEAARVTLGGKTTHFEWSADEYTAKKNQVVLGAEALDTAKEAANAAVITVQKDTPGLLFASATWHFSTENLPTQASGDFFKVERSFFQRLRKNGAWHLEPLTPSTVLQPGDQVEVHLSLRAKHTAEYVHLRDPRAAGFEPEARRSGWRWDLGIARYEEVRDSGMNFFFESLPVGEYTLKYRLRVATAGTFKVAPATVQSMYAPEFAAYSSGTRVKVQQ